MFDGRCFLDWMCRGVVNQAALGVNTEDGQVPFDNQEKEGHMVVEIPMALSRSWASCLEVMEINGRRLS